MAWTYHPLPEHPFHPFHPAFLLGFRSTQRQDASDSSLGLNSITEAWAATCTQRASILTRALNKRAKEVWSKDLISSKEQLSEGLSPMVSFPQSLSKASPAARPPLSGSQVMPRK